MQNAYEEVLEARLESAPAAPEDVHRRARIALSTLFLVDGIGFGSWAALIPSFKHKFGVNDATLSAALFALVIGALIAMPLAGQAIASWGGRRVAVGVAFAFCGSLPLLAWAPGFAWLVAAAGLFGALKGSLDVSVNSQAVTVENAGRKPIMSSFQALWSLGGLFAAAGVSLALARGVPPEILLSFIALFLVVLTFQSIGRLLPEPRRERGGGSFSLKLPNPALLRLGLLSFLALFAEGVLMDWSAVYARSEVGASVALAPVAYAVYSLAMASGRLLGDATITRFGSIAVLRWSGILTAIGLLIVVGVRVWPATFAGLLVAGLGLSNLVPILFGAAGRAHPGGAGPGVATASTMGYLGFLSGPPIIGLLSGLAGLPVAFSLVIGFGVVIATLGVPVLRQSLNSPRIS